ncbi:hypothetical protein B0H10DRAFT_1975042 [Mycena sp. CBHHK59/15]|nr:hypothetical protein B0H10DRAFT_1975042 [Mycena sp. CBHHK59/15]
MPHQSKDAGWARAPPPPPDSCAWAAVESRPEDSETAAPPRLRFTSQLANSGPLRTSGAIGRIGEDAGSTMRYLTSILLPTQAVPQAERLSSGKAPSANFAKLRENLVKLSVIKLLIQNVAKFSQNYPSLDQDYTLVFRLLFRHGTDKEDAGGVCGAKRKVARWAGGGVIENPHGVLETTTTGPEVFVLRKKLGRKGEVKRPAVQGVEDVNGTLRVGKVVVGGRGTSRRGRQQH